MTEVGLKRALAALSRAELPERTRELERAELPIVGVKEQLEGFVVARRESQLIGCAGVEVYGTDGLLRSVAAAPNHRRGITLRVSVSSRAPETTHPTVFVRRGSSARAVPPPRS